MRPSVLAAAGTLGGGQIISRVLSLVRMAIIARLLSVHDFGIGATFLMTLAFVEMLSDVGLDKVLVQARDGDRLRFLATVHLLLVIRGFVVGVFLAGLAWPVAVWLFKVPDALWAFVCLSSVPIIRGFTNVDFVRAQREMRFGPSVLVRLVPELAATIAVWPLLVWLGSYAAVLWLIVGQSFILLVTTHVVASRPYHLVFNAETCRYVMAFGWPLVINGLVLYLAFHGDRVVIGGMLSMDELGIYTAALTLAQAPKVFAGRVVAALSLPLLARHQDDRDAFHRSHDVITGITAMLASGMVATLILVGGPVIVLVFGPDYSGTEVLFGWLLAMQGVRLLRIAPNRAAMALGDTRNTLVCNIVRSAFFGAIVLVLLAGGDIALVAAIGFVGEVAAYLTGILLLATRWGVPASLSLRPALVGAICPIGSVLILVCTPDPSWIMLSILTLSMALLVLGTMLLAVPSVRSVSMRMRQLAS